jgi:hypothetical protein
VSGSSRGSNDEVVVLYFKPGRMHDSDRFLLWFGLYCTPRFHYGARVIDAGWSKLATALEFPLQCAHEPKVSV